LEILTNLQEKILHLFSEIPDQEAFYLTGGTALSAFFLKHRRSNGLDSFNHIEIEELISPVRWEGQEMRPLSPDTRPEVERIHIEMIRKAPISLRLQMVTSLIQTTRQLSWRGICERYSKDTFESRLRRFILLLYRDEFLADRLINLMMKKGIR
jgi:hypothetical protein